MMMALRAGRAGGQSFGLEPLGVEVYVAATFGQPTAGREHVNAGTTPAGPPDDGRAQKACQRLSHPGLQPRKGPLDPSVRIGRAGEVCGFLPFF